MLQMVEKIFRRYGSAMLLYTAGGEEEFLGFLQPFNSRNRQRLKTERTVLGEVPNGVYVLILPAALQVAIGDSVGLAQKTYKVYRLENAAYGDEILYQWGLCTKEGGA